MNHLIDAGTHGLAAVSGASECHKLSLAERKWLAEAVIGEGKARVPVIVGVSATNTLEAVELARHAERASAAAVFATPCHFGAVTHEALRCHYGTLTQAASLPIIVQDAQVSVMPTHVARLVDEFPRLAYVKEEAPDSGHRITELRTLLGERVRVLSGGLHPLDDLARGALGAILGSVGVADLARSYDGYRQDNLAAARAAYDHFLPLAHWRRQFLLLGAKEVLRRIGVFKTALLRQPAGERLDEHDHRELSALMGAMGPPF